MRDERPNSEERQLRDKLREVLKRTQPPGYQPADDEQGVFARPFKRQKLAEDAPKDRTRDGR